MIKLISDRPTRDLPCCRSVIFFPAGVLPAGKKMTLRQHGRSRVVYRLHTEVGILAHKSVFPDFHGSREIPTFVRSPKHITDGCILIAYPYLSLSLFLRHREDTDDTSEHISARSCPSLSLFKTTWTHGTQASTSVLARVLISLSSRPRGRTGHERAHRCSPVSCMSLSLSLRRHGDIEDTSEHISARSCPCLFLFDTARTHRTRASTSVLARVLYVLIPLPSTPWGHRGHERALMC